MSAPVEFAFPTSVNHPGITIRDWFATFVPTPTRSQIEMQMTRDRNRNPHNDDYKPPLRSREEIIADLRYEFADAMIRARNR
jgi:hypothetical protein